MGKEDLLRDRGEISAKFSENAVVLYDEIQTQIAGLLMRLVFDVSYSTVDSSVSSFVA